ASVAVTGSDAYLRVGSDVAILFEPKEKGTALHDLLATQMSLMAMGGGAKAVSGKLGGVGYRGFVSPDRHISAYLANVGDTVVAGKVQRLAVETLEKERSGAGELSLGADGVRSSIYGTLEFMTPIIEMDMERATRGEAESYMRWRDSYQRNWSNYFDPIAVRL